ncbi:hypothetical protein HDU76_007011 [Blyttiomyces sp. JEL0837]|nr:hypothetical protein HDU76_007011 [Blyttiomyces sp. JEL0837]
MKDVGVGLAKGSKVGIGDDDGGRGSSAVKEEQDDDDVVITSVILGPMFAGVDRELGERVVGKNTKQDGRPSPKNSSRGVDVVAAGRPKPVVEESEVEFAEDYDQGEEDARDHRQGRVVDAGSVSPEQDRFEQTVGDDFDMEDVEEVRVMPTTRQRNERDVSSSGCSSSDRSSKSGSSGNAKGASWTKSGVTSYGSAPPPARTKSGSGKLAREVDDDEVCGGIEVALGGDGGREHSSDVDDERYERDRRREGLKRQVSDEREERSDAVDGRYDREDASERREERRRHVRAERENGRDVVDDDSSYREEALGRRGDRRREVSSERDDRRDLVDDRNGGEVNVKTRGDRRREASAERVDRKEADVDEYSNVAEEDLSDHEDMMEVDDGGSERQSVESGPTQPSAQGRAAYRENYDEDFGDEADEADKEPRTRADVNMRQQVDHRDHYNQRQSYSMASRGLQDIPALSYNQPNFPNWPPMTSANGCQPYVVREYLFMPPIADERGYQDQPQGQHQIPHGARQQQPQQRQQLRQRQQQEGRHCEGLRPQSQRPRRGQNDMNTGFDDREYWSDSGTGARRPGLRNRTTLTQVKKAVPFKDVEGREKARLVANASAARRSSVGSRGDPRNVDGDNSGDDDKRDEQIYSDRKYSTQEGGGGRGQKQQQAKVLERLEREISNSDLYRRVGDERSGLVGSYEDYCQKIRRVQPERASRNKVMNWESGHYSLANVAKNVREDQIRMGESSFGKGRGR